MLTIKRNSIGIAFGATRWTYAFGASIGWLPLYACVFRVDGLNYGLISYLNGRWSSIGKWEEGR